MNAQTRTVRLLDRQPGEPGQETREIAGFTIESGVPLPPPQTPVGAVQRALAALRPGDSFVHTHHAKDSRDRVRKAHPERSFAARKIAPGRFRIWRTK